MQCTTVHCSALNYTALHCTALHCTALHCTALHCTALHCTALQCTVLQCTAECYIPGVHSVLSPAVWPPLPALFTMRLWGKDGEHGQVPVMGIMAGINNSCCSLCGNNPLSLQTPWNATETLTVLDQTVPVVIKEGINVALTLIQYLSSMGITVEWSWMNSWRDHVIYTTRQLSHILPSP